MKYEMGRLKLAMSDLGWQLSGWVFGGLRNIDDASHVLQRCLDAQTIQRNIAKMLQMFHHRGPKFMLPTHFCFRCLGFEVVDIKGSQHLPH